MQSSPKHSDAGGRGILFVFSGPSGVGKGTVLHQALQRLDHLRESISATTRPPRPGEVNGEDYLFVNPDEFAHMLEVGELLEHAAVHSHFYGTLRPWVMEQLQAGIDVVLEIDVQGAWQVRASYPDAILIFLAPPNWDELARRLHGRDTEDEETIRLRLHNARREMARIDQYEYLIINDKLEEAVERFCAIVLAERSRPWRQDLHLLQEGEPLDG